MEDPGYIGDGIGPLVSGGSLHRVGPPLQANNDVQEAVGTRNIEPIPFPRAYPDELSINGFAPGGVDVDPPNPPLLAEFCWVRNRGLVSRGPPPCYPLSDLGGSVFNFVGFALEQPVSIHLILG